jgi:hypothetical protein
MKALSLIAGFLILARFTFGQTYTDVQSIFASKCAPCHHAGGAAPFALTAYDDVKKRTSFIKEVISTGYMPPWKADTHYRDFANNRTLDPKDKAAILDWIASNAPKGSTAAVKTTVPQQEPLNRAPDLVLKTTTSFTVKGNNQERFIVYKIPFELPDTQNVEGLELYTNNKKIIHHINYGFYNVPGTAMDLRAGPEWIDTDTDSAGIESAAYGPLKRSMVYYSGWIPGTTNEFYPKQFGWVLPKRGVLLLTVHYSAIAGDEGSVVGVKLFFKQQPVQRSVRIISLGSGGIGESDITPHLVLFPNEVSTFHLKVKTIETQSILYVWPHMHYLGKEFYAFAVTPEQDTINLVHIPAWDFRWQELYRMKKLVKIPAGSVINMVGVYDNTASNPANPNSPPKLVLSTADMKAADEMFTLMMIYVPYQTGDENISLE